jgi:hypothetical protein
VNFAPNAAPIGLAPPWGLRLVRDKRAASHTCASGNPADIVCDARAFFQRARFWATTMRSLGINVEGRLTAIS